MKSKRVKIKDHTAYLLQESYKEMKRKIDKAINSGAIDIENWDPNTNCMIIPKSILIAILESEADQYKGVGTRFEKEVRKNVDNLKCFI